MDDDLLNPIDIDLGDYEDEADISASALSNPHREEEEKPTRAANPVPNPDELDRVLSGAPQEDALAPPQAPQAPPAAPPEAPAVKQGVPPLPGASAAPQAPPVAPPPQSRGVPPLPDAPQAPPQTTPQASAAPQPAVAGSNPAPPASAIENEIRPIDVSAPVGSTPQFGAADVGAASVPPPQAPQVAPPVAPDISQVPPPAAPEMPSVPPVEVNDINVEPAQQDVALDQVSEITPSQTAPSAPAEAQGSVNRVKIGEEINLTRVDPGLKKVLIGMGWDAKIFADESTPDLDVSLFLLNKDDMTRDNEDFVFYNNMEACDGGVQHHGDNRTGAGDGDDENITITLSDIPFDIMRIEVVLSIYQGLELDQSFKDVENIFFRLVNADTQIELLRLELDKIVGADAAIGVKIGHFSRIGPNWMFEAGVEPVPKGLEESATEFGIVVAELL